MNSSRVAQPTLAAVLRQAGAELQVQNPPPELQARVRAGVGAALRPRAPALAGWRGGVWGLVGCGGVRLRAGGLGRADAAPAAVTRRGG